jgi:hypothetical protein
MRYPSTILNIRNDDGCMWEIRKWRLYIRGLRIFGFERVWEPIRVYFDYLLLSNHPLSISSFPSLPYIIDYIISRIQNELVLRQQTPGQTAPQLPHPRPALQLRRRPHRLAQSLQLPPVRIPNEHPRPRPPGRRVHHPPPQIIRLCRPQVQIPSVVGRDGLNRSREYHQRFLQRVFGAGVSGPTWSTCIVCWIRGRRCCCCRLGTSLGLITVCSI